MFSVKNASEADLPVIRELAVETWWPTYGTFLDHTQIQYMLDTIYSEEGMRNAIMADGQQFLLLVHEDKPIGFASYSPWPENSSAWKINKLYIHPSWQGRKLGRLFIEEIANRAIARNMTSLVLNVNRNNPAIRFYERNGFSILREEDIPIGPYWMNDYVMVRKLED